MPDTVAVDFDMTYPQVIATLAGGARTRDRWNDLAGYLGDRPGWVFSVDADSGPVWHFGPLRTHQLEVFVPDRGNGWVVRSAHTGREERLLRLDQVRTWVTGHEPGSTALPVALLADAARSGWEVLTVVPFTATVTAHGDGLHIHVDGLPTGDGPVDTLDEAVAAATARICAVFHAPAHLAAQVALAVTLDPQVVAGLCRADPSGAPHR